MIYCVEVLAIYENPGTVLSGARVTQRDSDFTLATNAANAVGRAVAPQANEYLETFAPPSRYGFGWRCRQWITLSQDASTVGNAIWNRLTTRSLQNGTKVEVFPLDETQQVYTTGATLFRRAIPSGSDIG